MAKENVEFILKLTAETAEKIENLCAAGRMNKNALFSKSLALMEVAFKE